LGKEKNKQTKTPDNSIAKEKNKQTKTPDNSIAKGKNKQTKTPDNSIAKEKNKQKLSCVFVFFLLLLNCLAFLFVCFFPFAIELSGVFV
jgi:hypothetical protein